MTQEPVELKLLMCEAEIVLEVLNAALSGIKFRGFTGRDDAEAHATWAHDRLYRLVVARRDEELIKAKS